VFPYHPGGKQHGRGEAFVKLLGGLLFSLQPPVHEGVFPIFLFPTCPGPEMHTIVRALNKKEALMASNYKSFPTKIQFSS
jgi:hypothetical protein